MSQDTVKSETYAEFVARLLKPGTSTEKLVHGALGIGGETGEVVDLIKKHSIYDKPLDKDKVIEELGDMMYYMQVIMNEFNVEFIDVAEKNMEKLNKRYGNGAFSAEQAIARADKA